MSDIVNDVSERLSARLKAERERRGWSIADLAKRSGVSKAMISRVERHEASPTAALLGRLSGAFGLTLSALLSRLEDSDERLRRAAEQPVWTDPGSGYVRRQISPTGTMPLELTQVRLPPGARVAFPASSYAFIRQLIWVQKGTLAFREGSDRHRLRAGDCLALGPPQDCEFSNEGNGECVYVVAVARL
ncbi:MAG TPA: XRE family transcriptional regulator [Alphaproteobacteria bacterium]|nr:XRE family transcriptional regulator [Alphaproteobacteria bacterium]